jgi:hypothetical protein
MQFQTQSQFKAMTKSIGLFQKFVDEVNSGMVDAIPILAYHIIDNSKDPSSTERKYLQDNGFREIPMSDLG